MKSRDIVPERGVRGLLPELEFLRTEGSGGGLGCLRRVVLFYGTVGAGGGPAA